MNSSVALLADGPECSKPPTTTTSSKDRASPKVVHGVTWIPQLALTGTRDSPTIVHEQRTGLLMSPSSLANLRRSKKPENAVNVKLGNSTIPKRICRDVPALEWLWSGNMEPPGLTLYHSTRTVVVRRTCSPFQHCLQRGLLDSFRFGAFPFAHHRADLLAKPFAESWILGSKLCLL